MMAESVIPNKNRGFHDCGFFRGSEIEVFHVVLFILDIQSFERLLNKTRFYFCIGSVKFSFSSFAICEVTLNFTAVSTKRSKYKDKNFRTSVKIIYHLCLIIVIYQGHFTKVKAVNYLLNSVNVCR